MALQSLTLANAVTSGGEKDLYGYLRIKFCVIKIDFSDSNF